MFNLRGLLHLRYYKCVEENDAKRTMKNVENVACKKKLALLQLKNLQ